MQLTFSSTPLTELETELLLIPLPSDHIPDRLAGLSGSLGPLLQRLEIDFSGERDETAVGYPESDTIERVALVGLGPLAELHPERVRRSMAAGARISQEYEAGTVAVLVSETAMEHVQALAEGIGLAAYRFDRYKTADDGGFRGTEELTLCTPENSTDHEHLARRGLILSEATATARDLVNLSPDEKTARRFGDYVKQSAARWGYRAEVWDKDRIEKEGMRGLLAVNRGSQEPPTFSILEWEPDEPAGDRPVILVGKGVMFDTGGLSLKSTKGSMDKMKSDMAGAAAVVGTLEAAARLELPVHLIGLIPATDNRPGENAYVPGDILKMHSGATVEVMNTDAEGRLILADALSFARGYEPALVIDLATLTGAQVVALGTLAAAVFSPETERSEQRLSALREAGRRSGDRVEPLPLYDEYSELLESSVADMKNVGGRKAGAITAAKFLEHFIDYEWVHVDIAGPAFLDAASGYRPKGGTGFGVRLLFEYLTEYSS